MRTFVLLALILFAAACAPGVNESLGTASAEGLVAGFWRGLWHGMILPVTFVVSLFSDAVQIYEIHNNGAWYNLGYLLGVSCTFGSSCGAARSGRRARST